MPKIKFIRFVIIAWFVFETLIVADVIHVAVNKISWGWLGYNLLAWLIIELINLVCRYIKWPLNLSPLFSWFLIAIVINETNGIFFYESTYGQFDRFAHFFLLGFVGSLACFNLFSQFLRYKNIELNMYIKTVLIFMFMNTLSVLHEIAEYALTAFHLVGKAGSSEMLPDFFDTWDDLFMLATGSLLALIILFIFKRLQKKINSI